MKSNNNNDDDNKKQTNNTISTKEAIPVSYLSIYLSIYLDGCKVEMIKKYTHRLCVYAYVLLIYLLSLSLLDQDWLL